MKREQGITLISLIIYIILITFIVAGVSSVTTSFYSNINDMDKTSESAVSLAKFNMYFINDIKSKNAQILNSSTNSVEIKFTNEKGQSETVKYSVQNNSLYRNKVKICGNIKEANITTNKGSGSTIETVSVYLKINNYERTLEYALEPKTAGTSESGGL